MQILSRAFILFVLSCGLISCNVSTPNTTEIPTPVPSATNFPTQTATSTSEPTSTPTPTEVPTRTPIPPTETSSIPDLPLPSGEPLANWNDIPIMPMALAGDGDNLGYSFILKASVEEVKEFYEKELPKLGWDLLAVGEGRTNSIILIFVKGGTLSVTILPRPEDLVYVMLVK